MLTIDGRQGEGGGQLLRTSLSLAALTGQPFEMAHIRAGRRRPGLRPQHLLAVRALAALCGARLTGDKLDSLYLRFEPTHRPRGGVYHFDVQTVAQGGSAGAVTLIFEALLWPLLFADAPASVTLRGGTHVPFSPPYTYVAETAHPLFSRLGAVFTLQLRQWGWYPAGGGEMHTTITPISHLTGVTLAPIPPDKVHGLAVATNLPSHIPQRLANRAANLLTALGLSSDIRPQRAVGPGPGAGLCLWLPQAGFSALGRPGLPAEQVAEAAVAELRAFMDNHACVDPHLADQLLLPAALAQGESFFTTSALTDHTLTQAALLRRWLPADIVIEGERGRVGAIRVRGIAYRPIA